MTSFEEIYDSISPAQINLKSFETKESLNPKLWNENGELDPKIRKRLLTIAMDFYDSLNIETLPKDIIIVGSSHMDGTYVFYDQTVDAILTEKLNHRYSIYNLGTADHNIYRSCQYLPVNLSMHDTPPKIAIMYLF